MLLYKLIYIIRLHKSSKMFEINSLYFFYLLLRMLREEGKCPMCGESVDYRRLVKIDDVTLYLDFKSSE